jgi:hypothetical protein
MSGFARKYHSGSKTDYEAVTKSSKNITIGTAYCDHFGQG